MDQSGSQSVSQPLRHQLYIRRLLLGVKIVSNESVMWNLIAKEAHPPHSKLRKSSLLLLILRLLLKFSYYNVNRHQLQRLYSVCNDDDDDEDSSVQLISTLLQPFVDNYVICTRFTLLRWEALTIITSPEDNTDAVSLTSTSQVNVHIGAMWR